MENNRIQLTPKLKEIIMQQLCQRKTLIDLRKRMPAFFKSDEYESELESLPMRDMSDDSDFTQEEIDSITKIYLNDPNPDDLIGVEALTNLKELVVESGNSLKEKSKQKKYSMEFCSIDELPTLSQGDMESISKCTSLRRLSISNQAIRNIDISNLINLEEFQICGNPYLDSLKGLEYLSNLRNLVIFGNNRLFSVEDLNEVIERNKLSELRLDVLLYPDAINYSKDTGQYDVSLLRKIQEMSNRAVWTEQVNGRDTTHDMSTQEMKEVHNKSIEILENYVAPSDKKGLAAKTQTIIGIESYLARNVRVDDKGESLQVHYDENGEQKGKKHGTNSIYNALMFNSAICEGYTHAMQYLLKLKGIRSHNTYCLVDSKLTSKDKLGMSNPHFSLTSKDVENYVKEHGLGGHSIVCIEDKWYSDLLADSVAYHSKKIDSLPFGLKTKSQISQTHVLSFGERSVVSPVNIDLNNAYIQKFIKSNDLFIQSKMSDLANTQKKMKENIKENLKDQGEQSIIR